MLHLLDQASSFHKIFLVTLLFGMLICPTAHCHCLCSCTIQVPPKHHNAKLVHYQYIFCAHFWGWPPRQAILIALWVSKSCFFHSKTSLHGRPTHYQHGITLYSVRLNYPCQSCSLIRPSSLQTHPPKLLSMKGKHVVSTLRIYIHIYRALIPTSLTSNS